MPQELPFNPNAAGEPNGLGTRSAPRRGLPHSGVADDTATNARTEDGASSQSTSNRSAAGEAQMPELVEETRMQIRGLIQEVAQLSQSPCDVDEFLEGFAGRITTALASLGIAIWLQDEEGKLELAYRASLPRELVSQQASSSIQANKNKAPGPSEAQRQHAELLRSLLARRESMLVPPASRCEKPSVSGNPTQALLVIAPIRVDQEAIGLVEVFQRPGTGPTTQRGYLRFLNQMTDLASDYFKSQRLRSFHEQRRLWGRLEQFIRGIHHSLDLRETSYQLANEGRRVLDCDRLTVLTWETGKAKVQAVSGLDAVDRRAADLKQLAKIATTTLATGEAFWFNGESSETPPQVEKVLQPYVDRTHTKWLGILPLHAPGKRRDESSPEAEANDEHRPIVGALVVEQLSGRVDPRILKNRSLAIAPHAADALHNVLTYRSIPFATLWSFLAKASWLWKLRNTPTTIPIVAAVVAVIAALWMIPADFEVGSSGTLSPKLKRNIFAPMDGTVVDIMLPTDSQQTIAADSALLQLENPKLEMEITELEGQEREFLARRDSLKRELYEQHSTIEPAEETRLETELYVVEQSVSTVRRELEIKRRQLAELLIKSPSQGLISDWQAQRQLEHRRVRLGQVLLTMVDPDGPWQLELEVPEKEIGHLLRARKGASAALPVTFVLASAPELKFNGVIDQVHLAAEVRESQQHVVLVTVAIDKERIPKELLLHGTRIQARIECGRKSIGYVLFHDVIEAAHERILFWF